MPIIGSDALQKSYHRLTITMGNGLVDNVLISSDGLYSIYYVRNGQYVNGTGRIPKVVTDYRCPQNSYILFDYSCDQSAKRERIFFYQVQMIKDVTPNNAYKIAVEHGFEGTVEDWLESLKGKDGKNAYELAVECGFQGTLNDWLNSLKGEKGDRGEKGDPGKKGEKGDPGKNAYELAVEQGFSGSIEDWFAQFGDVTIIKQQMTDVQNHISWIQGMGNASSMALVH